MCWWWAAARLDRRARQLALHVLIYSPIQMAADLTENYAKHPDAFKFIMDVPADWAETHQLAGTDDTERRFDLPLGFLEPGRRYEAQINADGPDSDFRTNARARIAISRRTVTVADRMPVRMGPGGGLAIRFRAL